MQEPTRIYSLPLHLQIRDQNFLRPGTQSALNAISSKVIYRVNNTFSKEKKNSDYEWSEVNHQQAVSKLAFISKSTKLSLVFADKGEKKCSNTNLYYKCDFSTSHTEPVEEILENNNIISQTQTYIHFMNRKINPHELLENTRNQIFSKISSTEKKTKVAKERKKTLCIEKSTLIDSFSENFLSKYRKTKLRGTLPIKRILNKSQQERQITFTFPELSLSPKGLLRVPSQVSHKKSFAQLKNLPLYRFSVENNIYLRIRNCKARLK